MSCSLGSRMTHIHQDQSCHPDLNYDLNSAKDSVMSATGQSHDLHTMEVDFVSRDALCCGELHDAETTEETVTSELSRGECGDLTDGHGKPVVMEMEQSRENVIVVQGGNDLVLEGADSSLLKCVKSLLAGGGGNSLMIVTKDGVHKEVSLSSDVHINEILPAMESKELLSYPVNLPSSQDPHVVVPSTSLTSPVISTVPSARTAPVPSSAVLESKGHTNKSSSQSFQHNKQIKTTTQPVMNSPERSISTRSSAAASSVVPTAAHGVGKSHKNLQASPAVPQTGSALSEPTVKTSGLDTHRSPAAQQLLTIAKKMMEEKALVKPLSSVEETGESSSSLGASDVKSTSCSDSIITMYLSSPDELKDKLEKLKTNSPVIVMQAGEDLLVGKKEVLDKDHCSDNSEETVPSGKQSSGNSSSESLVAALSSLSSSPVVYRCVECGYSSHNKHYYKQHVDLVHNADRPYKCPHCDYAGKRRHALLEHMVVHSNQRPFTCDHCNASFRKKGHLTNHVKLHTSQRLVHCGVCNIQLPDSEAFEAHLRKIHNTDKLYKCKLCDHTVVDREAMLNHLQSHNQAIVYSCPKCPNLYNDEESLVAHMKSCHEFVFVDGSSSVKAASTADVNVVQPEGVVAESQPANIMCSECGFVCSKAAAMKKHMWVHIKKESGGASGPPDKQASGPAECGATLGVLKMNVNKGQKSLPENVTYQCSSCSFSSSDNSVFIKHMLAHKTQNKQQNITLAALVKNPRSVAGFENVRRPTTSNPSIQQEQPQAAQSVPEVKYSGGTNVPFVYDKSAGRYRCVICGYHCEFQRTIKAHIWKHSGHQNIQYPVFEPSGKTTVSPAVSGVKGERKEEAPQWQQTSTAGSLDTGRSTGAHNSSVKTEAGLVIQLLPVDASSTCFLKNSSQVNASSLNSSTQSQTCASTEKLPEALAFAEVDSVPSSDSLSSVDSKALVKLDVVVGEKPQASATQAGGGVAGERGNIAGGGGERGNVAGGGGEQGNIAGGESEQRNIAGGESERGNVAGEGCTEPGVVVEIVDSVPSSLGLTGMKSQQGSPRVLDLDGSGSEATLLKSFQTYSQNKRLATNAGTEGKVEAFDEVQPGANPQRKKASVKQEESGAKVGLEPAVRLRCPSCDCVLMNKEALRSHLLSCQSVFDRDNGQATLSVAQKDEASSSKHLSDHDDTDTVPTEDSDATESSDEQTGPGEGGASGSQQKTGICSSLLAVIEQLRERSQSESEDAKTTSHLHKGGRRRNRQSGDTSPLTADDFQNIEKIRENGSDKFRCSLCHYTSQRICNMKLHMKTHRQKKPSECSLCDFSSTSSEALQEHMLKHCKVRTYACKFCPQSFNHKSTLRAHLRAHKDHEPFLCAYCVFETSNPLEYREHMQVHSGCSSRLRCPLCDNIFGNKEELTSHLLKCKGSRKKSEVSEDVTATQQKEKEVVEKVQSEVGLPAGTTAMATTAPPTQHMCVVSGCSFTSSNLKELQDHLSVHCNPSLLVCNLCDFKALHSRSLKSHMKRHANDQRYVQQPLEQYKCNLCGYVCHHLPSLKSHMWRHASDQSYSYEFTNDVINAAIDHDTRVDSDSTEVDDPELLDRVINSERKILEGELTKCSRGDGQRPICWVTFRCCSCGFETINKAKLNIHMRSHSDLIQQALDVPRKSTGPGKPGTTPGLLVKTGEKRALTETANTSPYVYVKVRKT
ncbi:uncharacterized protein LOC101855769 [Aplysia californica]|uniref:Uncharacterized protein LOC101855769 n=1 Tax=Aplysia californica TaxID=6500 RepID=A0ABM0KAU0_APLCA|nr:uncharacterized protein LOC101855769 [Aplysia californica]